MLFEITRRKGAAPLSPSLFFRLRSRGTRAAGRAAGIFNEAAAQLIRGHESFVTAGHLWSQFRRGDLSVSLGNERGNETERDESSFVSIVDDYSASRR